MSEEKRNVSIWELRYAELSARFFELERHCLAMEQQLTRQTKQAPKEEETTDE